MLCSSLRTRLQSWLRDYDKLQSVAVILLYVQIGCSLVGSLGALYTGVLLINLAIALFALVAIESGSQSLGRTYAFLLFSAILLDIFWFLLFSYDIWHISSENNGASFIFSLKLTLLMQILGLSVRISSAFLWIQMYRLGLAYVESAVSREADFDLRNSFLSPTTPAVVRQSSDSDDQLGGSIYDPAYYSSLFEVNQDEKHSKKGQSDVKDGDSSSQTESCILKLSVGSAFQTIVNPSYMHMPFSYEGHLVNYNRTRMRHVVVLIFCNNMFIFGNRHSKVK